ncbi:MAG TPA: Ig-like domain-containing protein [Candidatus Limnocylindrales bacterium]|nr:Ig-like domain-containing protein [Candidatus Limnocylindrales bacterium]
MTVSNAISMLSLASALTALVTLAHAQTPPADPTATARQAAPIILTGLDIPDWSRAAAAVVCQPYPSGALTGERTAHNGTTFVPPDVRAGVDPNQIVAFAWRGTGFEEIPVQVDEIMPYCLANPNSDFGIYSGTDKELSYAWDVESWKKVAGTCTAEYDEGESATPDPAPTLDDDDEIVFMASDAGTVAPSGAPLPFGVNALHAVAIVDPLAPTTASFVYLGLREGGSAFDASNGYVSYVRDANADQWIDRSFYADNDPEKLGSSNTGYGPNLSGTVCDENGVPRSSNDRFPRDGVTVSTDTYHWRATGRWMVRNISVARPGAPGVYGPDLVDRWKGRAFQQSPDSTISIVGFEDEQVNWEANSALLGELTGPVRAIRETWGADSGTNVTKTEAFYRDVVTYRYHVRVHPIPPDGLYTSWDYNAGVATTYYNTLKPGGVAIDGVNDDVGNVDAVAGRPAFFDLNDPTFNVPSALLNWEQVSGAGDAGSLVYIIEMKGATSVENSAVVPYYRDDACVDDGTGDDPVQRPWPGESSTDQRVKDGYVALAGGTPYEELECIQKQGAWGAHGVHYFVDGDTDNAFLPETVTEIDAQQWQFMVPTSAPTNVGDAYGNNVRVPLQTAVIPVADAPAGLPPTASNAQATTERDHPVTVTLSAVDNDTCELAFRIVDAPANGDVGEIAGAACAAGSPHSDTAQVTYSPADGFVGTDTFTYVANDGTSDSQPATVTITVTPPPPPCATGPQDGCRLPVKAGKAKITLRNGSDDEEELLSWRWTNGEATATEDFGHPNVDTAYELCVFDAAGEAVAAFATDPEQDCNGRPCWKPVSRGYAFDRRVEDEETGDSSTARLTLRGGEEGKARITASIRGSLLDVGALPAEQPVSVQLRASNGECWEALYSAPARTNTESEFVDNAD